MSEPEEPFYIGYESHAPGSVALFVRVRVVALVLVVFAVGAAVAASQNRFAPSRYEFGVARSFEGRLEHIPYPVLAVQRPGTSPGQDAGESLWLLSRFGKTDAADVTRALDGHRVRVEGALIHRGTVTMLEIDQATLEDLGAVEAPDPLAQPLGEPVTLVGEIVDAKCHLGMMKPGDLKPHRACAVRCIDGGVPAALAVRDASGSARYYLLADEEGEPVGSELLDRVAEPVKVTGRVREIGELSVLHAPPEAFERVE